MLSSVFRKLKRGVVLILIMLEHEIHRRLLLYWDSFPFGKEPLATQTEYEHLAKRVQEQNYPEVDTYEHQVGFAIIPSWLHELALHTQVVIKKSPLCYAHGRVLYSALSAYLHDHPPEFPTDRLTIWETGTARGFSAICMAKALKDQNRAGTIITFDRLPHHKPIYWNCIDDCYGPKTRAQLLAPWHSLMEDFIIFHQGDTRLELLKVQASRIHFAFLDGTHSYTDVMFEFNEIRDSQYPGDIIVFDDYTPRQFPGLVKAVNEICDRYQYQQTVLRAHTGRGYVVATKI